MNFQSACLGSSHAAAKAAICCNVTLHWLLPLAILGYGYPSHLQMGYFEYSFPVDSDSREKQSRDEITIAIVIGRTAKLFHV